MRYDTPIYFQSIKKGAYDPNTGDYGEGEISETQVYASVRGASIETLNLIYGKIKQNVLSVHIQTHYTSPFDGIRIGAKTYHVDNRRTLKVKEAFLLSESS